MNKFITNTLNYFRLNDMTKSFLIKSPELFEDINYINEMFEKNCLESNLEMVIFLNSNCLRLDGNSNSNIYLDYYCQELFKKMCVCSDLETITWFYNNFSEKINLANIEYLNNSLKNPNLSVIKFIMSAYKYPKNIYECIFKYSISKLNIQLAEYVYSTKPEINLKVLNNVSLYNSIDVHTPNNIYKWLKTIGRNNSYEIKFTSERELIVIDELNILGEPVLINDLDFHVPTNISTDLLNSETNECVLCLEFTNDVMLNCTHKFCSHCIRNWIRKNRSCPVCRNEKNVIGFYI